MDIHNIFKGLLLYCLLSTLPVHMPYGNNRTQMTLQ